jgi:hypothetical protein
MLQGGAVDCTQMIRRRAYFALRWFSEVRHLTSTLLLYLVPSYQ